MLDEGLEKHLLGLALRDGVKAPRPYRGALGDPQAVEEFCLTRARLPNSRCPPSRTSAVQEAQPGDARPKGDAAALLSETLSIVDADVQKFRLRMDGVLICYAAVFCSKEAIKRSAQGTLELSFSIRRCSPWASEARNPYADKGSRNSTCCDVGNGYCLWPTSIPVNACKHIPEPITWRKGAYYVQMSMVKATIGWAERLERCSIMSYDLYLLAGNAVAGIVANIRVDIGPHIPVCDKWLRGSDTWVCDSMKKVENNTPKLLRDEQTRCFCRCVANKGRKIQRMWNRLQT